MKTIEGGKFLTIYAEPNEVYNVLFDALSVKLSILNGTLADIQVSTSKDFPETDDGFVGEFLTLPSNSAVNNLYMPGDEIYIKANMSGNIVIERCE